MKIAILGAMDQEIALLKESLKNINHTRHAHLDFYDGTMHDVEVILVKCGIGKVAASVATTLMIDQFAPDYVINTGSAGGFDTDLVVGDVVIGSEVLHHDADLTHFGYQAGQMAGMPARFSCDPRLIAAAEHATRDVLHVNFRTGLICTGDAFIGCDDAAATLRNKFADMKAVEMEGAAIAQTAHMLDTPFLVIRSLSDIAGTTSKVSFDQYLEKAAKNSANLVMDMIKTLANSR